MKAVVWTKYGSPEVLQLREVEKPIPKDNEVLVKIYATTVTAGDCEVRNLKFPFWLGFPLRLYFGLIKPIRVVSLGQELAGEVEAVGKAVTRFKPGDQVFGTTGFHFGAYAEYICLPESSEDGGLELKSPKVSYEAAAAAPTGGLEALHFLRKANIQRGQKLLIIGAGGSIGTFGVQLGKHYGAEVTAVDSAQKLEMLRSIGAGYVMDYAQEDFIQNGETYDVILDVVGKRPISHGIKSLKPDGTYLVVNPSFSLMFRAGTISRKTGRKIIIEAAPRKSEDLISLRELIESSAIKVVIDRRYPLEETADAHRYVEAGYKKGNVIITVIDEAERQTVPAKSRSTLA